MKNLVGILNSILATIFVKFFFYVPVTRKIDTVVTG